MKKYMSMQCRWRYRLLTACLCFICSVGAVSAQTETEFWFVAPHLDDNSGPTNYFDRPVFFMVTTGSEAATVTMSQPANPAFTPITYTIAANTSQQFIFETTEEMASISNDIRDLTKVGIKDNKEIYFESTAPVSIYYQVESTNSKDIFSLKGSKALGTEFYTPFQDVYLTTTGYPYGYAQFHIVATEDNTEVSITPAANIIGTNAGVTKKVTLQKGETFAARARDFMQTARLAGSHIVSDKPVAVTVCDDLISTGGGADVIGDQLVPVTNLGTNYVVLRGYTTDTYGDYIYVLATEDNTEVYLRGSTTSVATLAKGATYSFKLLTAEPAIVVNTSKPAYVFQLSGVEGEMGAVLVPSMYSINSRRIGFNKSTIGYHYLFLMVRSGTEDGFLVNNSASIVTAADFKDVPGMSDWKYARINITNTVSAGECFV